MVAPSSLLRGSIVLVTAQVAIVLLGLAALAFAPPAEGRLWLVPLTPGAAAALPTLAIGAGARLLASGPLPGSQIIVGRGTEMARPMLRAGIVVLASPPAGCGTGRGRA